MNLTSLKQHGQINFKPSRWDNGLMRFRIRTCLTDTTVSDNYYDLLNPVSINSFNVLKSFQFVSEADLMIRLYIFKQTKHQLSWIAASVSPPAVTACTTKHKRQTLEKDTKWFLSQSESTISVQVYCHWVGTPLAFHFKAFISFEDCWKTETTACWKRFYSKRFSRYFWRRTLLATHWWFSSL